MSQKSTKPQLLETVNAANEDQITTFREFSKIYNTMSEICFNHCVWDFGTDQIRNREMRCAMNCTEQYLKMTKLVGNEFAKGQAANIIAATSDISP